MASDPLDHGQLLQLPVYALAARQAFDPDDTVSITGSYRFVGDGDDIEVDVDDAAMDRFTSVLETIVTSIRGGQFPARPGEARSGRL